MATYTDTFFNQMDHLSTKKPIETHCKHQYELTDTHLAMVGTAVLGHGTLSVHQEAVPPPLLRQCCFIALGDEGVQVSLLAADSLHILMKERIQKEETTEECSVSSPRDVSTLSKRCGPV